MTFALVAFLTIAGQIHTYVLDDGMSYAECMSAVQAGVMAATDNAGRLVDLSGAAVVCELQS